MGTDNTGNRTYNKTIVPDWFSVRPFVTKWARYHLGVQLQVSSLTVRKCFSLLLFCVLRDYSNSKQKAKQYTKNLIVKLENTNQNSRLTWLGLKSGFEQLSLGAPLLDITKSTFYDKKLKQANGCSYFFLSVLCYTWTK